MQAETLNIFLVIFAGLNIALLIFTLRIVWKYTKEIEVVGKYMGEIEKIRQALTRQSEELANQRRLSVLPTLAAWLRQDESGSPIHRLYIKNVGNGIAMNIEIARIDFVVSSKDADSPDVNFDADEFGGYRLPTGQSGYSVFQPIQILGPNSEQVVKSFNYPSDPDQASEMIRQYGYTGFDFLSLIDEETPLHIDFQDVEGNQYHQVITRKGDTFAPGPVESRAIDRSRRIPI
ncbi:MAG TPA: hypothetical protein VFY40_02840 [Blastocatellia bacterium]|nr:hypothetical protein [Blastocatellia bacterium]